MVQGWKRRADKPTIRINDLIFINIIEYYLRLDSFCRILIQIRLTRRRSAPHQWAPPMRVTPNETLPDFHHFGIDHCRVRRR